MLRMVKIEFADWLVEETKKRRWSYRELGRRANLYSSAISQVVTRRNFPGPEFCNSIARAFKLPPEYVYRLAGILPPITSGDKDKKLKQECDGYWNYLDSEHRRTITDLARTLYERREEYTIKKERQTDDSE